MGFGSPVRYGATTKDGEGEVVNGMVMMLKGENSAEIINLVKQKMEQIKPTLPEGVDIVPYLDRSKLVNRGEACLYLGHAENHSAEVARFMKLSTKRVVRSRDV